MLPPKTPLGLTALLRPPGCNLGVLLLRGEKGGKKEKREMRN